MGLNFCQDRPSCRLQRLLVSKVIYWLFHPGLAVEESFPFHGHVGNIVEELDSFISRDTFSNAHVRVDMEDIVHEECIRLGGELEPGGGLAGAI